MDTKINRAERRLPRLKAQLQAKFKAGVRDERGAAAVFFAIGLVLLAPAALGLVDVYLTTTQRAERTPHRFQGGGRIGHGLEHVRGGAEGALDLRQQLLTFAGGVGRGNESDAGNDRTPN